ATAGTIPGRRVNRSMSPANWPGPCTTTLRLPSEGFKISTAPDSITYKSSSASPARKIVSPSSNEHDAAMGLSDARSLAVRDGKAIASDSVVKVFIIPLFYAGTEVMAYCWHGSWRQTEKRKEKA